jgi:hypothetical protein
LRRTCLENITFTSQGRHMVDQGRLGEYPLSLPNSGLPCLRLLVGGERGWTFVRRVVLRGLYRCFLGDNRRLCGVVPLGLLGNAMFRQGYVSNSLGPRPRPSPPCRRLCWRQKGGCLDGAARSPLVCP